MRISNSTRAFRPALPKRLQTPFSPRYSTLSSSRPLPPAPLRFPIHPALFLAHVSGITVASCLIPVIGARSTSTRTAPPDDSAFVSDNVETPVPFDYPIQQPFPPRYQRLSLASHLRRQLEASPLDAAFTLRQLHLVNQPPQLYLPDQSRPHPPSQDLSNLLPEPWIWRRPAAAALHSILRILHSNPDPRFAEPLLPIALRIARHSLRFDALMWDTILKNRKDQVSVKWAPFLASERVEAQGVDGTEEPLLVTNLKKRRRERSPAPRAEEWERHHEELSQRVWANGSSSERSRGDWRVRSDSRTEHYEMHNVGLSAPATPLHPASSLPTKSLELLVARLAEHASQHSDHTASALSIALSLSNLRRSRSHRSLDISFSLAIKQHRPDLAARFFVDSLDQFNRGRTPRLSRRLSGQLWQLSQAIRSEQGGFAASPSPSVLAAVATLAHALDEQWTRSAEQEGGVSPRLVGILMRLLAAFPPAPHASDFPAGSVQRAHARKQARVAQMVTEALRRVIEDVVDRDVHLGPAKALVGEGPFASSPPCRPLTVADYNGLIAYSLFKLQSPELALLLLRRMTASGIAPSAATHNLLFTTLERKDGRTTSFRELLARKPQNERTLLVFLNHLTRTASFDELDRIVFHLLPELDRLSISSSAPVVEHDATPTSPSPLRRLPVPTAPPSTGRSPYLYTVLLTALARAGRVGLVERVFRNARWAAELSRTAREEETGPAKQGRNRRRPGWILPPHAFTIMLQLYAAEAKRGRRVERQSNAPDDVASAASPFVRGWGRHALRVFLLNARRAEEQEALGGSPDTTSKPAFLPGSAPSLDPSPRHALDLAVPHFLRAEAAPIVAVWELEGGSKGPELESLRRAMNSPQTQGALKVLFPRGPAGETRSARQQFAELVKLRRRRGVRPAKDVVVERARARSMVLRERDLRHRVEAIPPEGN
ncbi:hypothetical protein JCM11641_006828 [Rhodosporidiobolus odoratus]